MAGFDIAQLKGTPLYELAKNANVYGGRSLSKTEMVFFQQQCKEMGFDPEKYGLEIIPEDIEGENFKETKKNMERITDSINDAYKSQFGKKNNAVATAKDAETKAYAIINTAKEGFSKAHGDDNNFIPDSLGQRPNFMDPQYKDNLTKYVTDLNVWANKVAEQYRNAADMTNQDLAAMIMQNDDANAALNAQVTVAVGESLAENMQELQKQLTEGKAEIIKEVQIQGGATRVAIKNAEGEIINAVRTAEGHLMSEIQWQGFITRGVVIDQGKRTREAVYDEGFDTRKEVQKQGEETRETVDEAAKQTQTLNSLADKVGIMAFRNFHTEATMTRVTDMTTKILESNLSYKEKKALLTHLGEFAAQEIMTDSELKAEEARIQEVIDRQ